MEPTNEGGIVQAESKSEKLEGEIGEDEAEAEKEEEVEEADRHQLLLELNLHLSDHKIMKSFSSLVLNFANPQSIPNSIRSQFQRCTILSPVH